MKPKVLGVLEVQKSKTEIKIIQEIRFIRKFIQVAKIHIRTIQAAKMDIRIIKEVGLIFLQKAVLCPKCMTHKIRNISEDGEL